MACLELHEDSMRGVSVPLACAHGFVTFEDRTVVEYLVDTPCMQADADGERWDDAALGISWPIPSTVLAPSDVAHANIIGCSSVGVAVV